MQYREIAGTDLKVSAVGLGTWAYGNDTFGRVDDQKSIQAIKTAVFSGINLIDTAPAYGDGHAEKIVGKAIKGIKDQVIIASKCGTYRDGSKYIRDLSPARIRKDLELSLDRLEVEEIDIYQIHWPDPDTPLEESIEELKKLKNEGKFKYLAVCNFDINLLDKIRELADIISLQPQYSLLKRDIEAKIIPYLIEHQLAAISYGTLGGGILSGKYKKRPDFSSDKENRDSFYPFFKKENWGLVQKLIKVIEEIAAANRKTPAQVAINWAINRAGITTALVGAKNKKQAAENAGAAEFNLSEKEMELLTEKSDQIISKLEL
ncbi:aldo/keto reductase [Halanaerobium hydrogeniformans]|uniref:Aldo/keto reductase n=1 Tax=Halanaerobium hydrogeniformans TaxID=656519 RepID=E4RK39_HALHG|nr:aldo/keto reductase [Halanaerobium hydrogeniformans]ADQ14591.1 aldo/keto reductase [Halanaerobium hydrogeniformans]